MNKSSFQSTNYSSASSYRMLGNVCGTDTSVLGVGTVAPVTQYLGADPAIQQVGVYTDYSYEFAPYAQKSGTNLLQRGNGCRNNPQVSMAYGGPNVNSQTFQSVARGPNMLSVPQ